MGKIQSSAATVKFVVSTRGKFCLSWQALDYFAGKKILSDPDWRARDGYNYPADLSAMDPDPDAPMDPVWAGGFEDACFGQLFFRHDPELVATVEEMGAEAGDNCDLAVVEVPYSEHWIVFTDLNGLERVEPMASGQLLYCEPEY